MVAAWPAPHPPLAEIHTGAVTYTYTVGIYTIVVSYEAPAGWTFLRKSLSLTTSTPGTPVSLLAVSPFDVLRVAAASALTSVLYPSGDMGVYGTFARFAGVAGHKQ